MVIIEKVKYALDVSHLGVNHGQTDVGTWARLTPESK